MDIITLLGLLLALGSIVIGYLMSHGILFALLKPASALIVIGGTFGATIVSFPVKTIRKFPAILNIAFKKTHIDLKEHITYFKEISIKSRKEGLLSLESEIIDNDLDPFIKKGLQMVVDGIDPQAVKSVLETKLDNLSARHEDCIEMFTAAGGYAPTMGIVGTVTSLIIVLSNLSDVAKMGTEIASAFAATLYGLVTANLFWLPISSKLKEINKEELIEKELIIEAILLIQEGVNPNTLVNKLASYLDDEQANTFEKQF